MEKTKVPKTEDTLGEEEQGQGDDSESFGVAGSTSTPPTSHQQMVVQYSKLVVPISMRSIYWKFFGFPASDSGTIISRQRIICILCKTQIAYNKNTSNLRMHLQNKHIRELMKIESKASPRTCKTKLLLKTCVKEEEAFMESSGEVIAMEPNETPDSNYSLTDEEMKVLLDSGSNMWSMVASFIVLDLEPPDVVDGRGFQRLLVNIKSPCSLPSREMLTADIIPKLYNQVRWKLIEELTNYHGDMGLTIEEWVCGRDRYHLSICVYYQTPQHEVECKMITTINFIPSMETSQWETILSCTLNEWNITPEKVTAVVCSTEREAILNAFCNSGYTLIPCLDFTINECVRQCFCNDVISEIIGKIRETIILLKNHPLTMETINQHAASAKLANFKLNTDVDAVWLSTLHMLECAVEWRQICDKLLDCPIGSPLKESLLLSDEEWLIIADLITVLQPFKISLMSLSEEKVPFISLLRPMLWQVVHRKLSIEDEDSETLRNLKKATVELLNYRYQDERMPPLLDMATIIDPRFKLLNYFTEEEKNSVTEMVMDLLLKIIIQENIEEDPMEDKKLTNMELLLGEYKPKVEKMDAEHQAKTEFEQYLNFTPAALDSCPTLWWYVHRDKYRHLGFLADKYLCVPAVATLPGKRTLDTMLSFHTRRSTLPENLLEEYLFLHVNYSVP